MNREHTGEVLLGLTDPLKVSTSPLRRQKVHCRDSQHVGKVLSGLTEGEYLSCGSHQVHCSDCQNAGKVLSGLTDPLKVSLSPSYHIHVGRSDREQTGKVLLGLTDHLMESLHLSMTPGSP